jgi:hypothetical protein
VSAEIVDYTLRFQTDSLDQFFKFGQLARQDYNLGNAANWYGAFIGGYVALNARLHGVALQYEQLHAWLPPRTLENRNIEYHLASIFFHMDSAVECFTFALNALGYAARPELFCDITIDAGLRRISPYNVMRGPNQPPYLGYSTIYPTLQEYWLANEQLLQFVFDHHDVSKHRMALFRQGTVRDDPPPRFFEDLGLVDGSFEAFRFKPLGWVGLLPNPKVPDNMRGSSWGHTFHEEHQLENMTPRFCAFMSETFDRALADAKASIQLPHTEFL